MTCRRKPNNENNIKPKQGYVLLYTLSDPITNEIRYVGKTTQSLNTRYSDHINTNGLRSKQNYKSRNWIKSLALKELLPKIEILDEVKAEYWEIEEKFYISYFRWLGFNLTNHQEGGGSGNIGRHWKISKEKAERKNNFYLQRDIGYKMYNLKGEYVKYFKNVSEISLYFNMSYSIADAKIRTKSLFNKDFIILPKEEGFDKKDLVRKYRRIKIINEDNKILIFNTQKECANYLNISLTSINRLIHNKETNIHPFKIELV